MKGYLFILMPSKTTWLYSYTVIVMVK